MPCPTCDHTIALFAENNGYRHFWCERCGTLVSVSTEDGHQYTTQPKLVGRVRQYQAEGILSHHWHKFGIAESIQPPGYRPHEDPQRGPAPGVPGPGSL